MPGQLLTQIETARYLGKDRDTIRRWTRLGELPTYVDPDSHRVMYPLPALNRWLAEKEAKAS